jgi:hypothetical protein
MSTISFALSSARSRRLQLPFMIAFAAAAVGAGVGRAITTSYLPVLLERIDDNPGLIGAARSSPAAPWQPSRSATAPPT